MERQVRVERIRCPNCEKAVDAEIVFENWMPFPAYIHTCTCGYVITESEWNPVKWGS